MVYKNRKDLFAQEYLRDRAAELFREIAEEYEYAIDEVEVVQDHIRLFLSFPPKYSIGEVVRTLKSISARELFRQYQSIKKRLWKGELWEDMYFAKTVRDKLTSDRSSGISDIIETRSNRKRSLGSLSCAVDAPPLEAGQFTPLWMKFVQKWEGNSWHLDQECHECSEIHV